MTEIIRLTLSRFLLHKRNGLDRVLGLVVSLLGSLVEISHGVFGVLLSAVAAAQAQRYEPTWESLEKHQDPDWFRDAKFGIYTHWGPVTVGAEDGPDGVQWYGRSMYVPKNATFEYHRKKYGDQNRVGYKDLISLFTAKKFTAAQWAELFAASGAKFAGPVVIHHDNDAMWDRLPTD